MSANFVLLYISTLHISNVKCIKAMNKDASYRNVCRKDFSTGSVSLFIGGYS